ncbi:MAG TPA: hypothetical protein VG796_25395 [Verrucomicrobiales bacterium]|nr:hypothetical protein [Verrucomicrobiales bacterium]
MQMNRAYRVALFCGLVPLLAGVSIFLLWCVTRWNWLMTAGGYMLLAGTLCIGIGAIALDRFQRTASKSPHLSTRRMWWMFTGCCMLFFSNFVTAGGIIGAVYYIQTGYTLTVHNHTKSPLSATRVTGGGCDADFGTIPPGASAERTFRTQQDGWLDLQTVEGSTARTHAIDDYVSRNRGADTAVFVEPDDRVTVRNLRTNSERSFKGKGYETPIKTPARD